MSARPACAATGLEAGAATPFAEVERANLSALRRVEYRQLAMGVEARIVLYAADESAARLAAKAAYDRISEIEQVASDYRPDSELMRLCAQAGGPAVRVSDDLYLLLETATRISAATNGAFDVTVGPLVALWREARRTKRLPNPDTLASARMLVGWRNIELDRDSRSVRLRKSGMRLDLGGIAKGYAGHEAALAIRMHGIQSCLVALAGDIYVTDAPPGEPGWHIARSKAPEPTTPVAGQSEIDSASAPSATPRSAGSDPLVLANTAVSTSGSAEQSLVIDGIRYSHIVDPRTGLGVTRAGTVTVVAADGATADGLASALCVLGEQEGAEALKRVPTARAFYESE